MFYFICNDHGRRLHVKQNAGIISKLFQNNFISHLTTALYAMLSWETHSHRQGLMRLISLYCDSIYVYNGIRCTTGQRIDHSRTYSAQ